MNIIFLDIDGVINTEYTLCKFRADILDKICSTSDDYRQIDAELLNNIKILSSITDSKVVISSDWRFAFKTAQIEELFARCGITLPIIGETPKLPPPKMSAPRCRACEIDMWISNSGIDVNKFIILDDNEITSYGCFEDHSILLENLLKTDDLVGFDEGMLNRAIEHFADNTIGA